MVLMAISGGTAALPVVELPSPAPSSPLRFSVSFGSTASTGSLPSGKSKERIALRAAARGSWGPPRDGARGAGLLERPTFDQSQFDPLPQPEEGGDMGKLRRRISLWSGDSYRVLLIDDSRHTENLVEKALPQAVPSVTASDARTHFHESRQQGVAIVVVTVKEHAEFYAQMMLRCGLRSAIEPDSSGGTN